MPGFPPDAPPFPPGRAPFPPPFLLEYRLLAVVLQVYSLCLRLLHLFLHKQIKANRYQHHLPCLQRQKGARNLPFLALKSGYDSWC